MANMSDELTIRDPVSELDAFIFRPDQFTKDDVPLGLDPLTIAKYVPLRVNRLSAVSAFDQARKVVDYYDVHEVAEHFLKMLDRREVTLDDLMRSSIATQIVGNVGQPNEVDVARAYFEYLVDKAEDPVLYERLVLVFDALGPGTRGESFMTKIAGNLAELQSKGDADAALVRRVQNLEVLVSKMQRAERANAIKSRVLEIVKRDARLDEQVLMYLGLKYGFGEYLPNWAARRLRRETWAEEPSRQTVRAPIRERTNEVVAALRRALPTIAAEPNLTEDEKEFVNITVLSAIAFFNGLSPEEREVLNEKRDSQKVILRPPR